MILRRGGTKPPMLGLTGVQVGIASSGEFC
jgi:hypothetical protein